MISQDRPLSDNDDKDTEEAPASVPLYSDTSSKPKGERLM